MSDVPQPAPGVDARRRRGVRWELVGCAFTGHVLIDPAAVPPERAALVRRQDGGLDWYRCLRCDAWLPVAEDHRAAVATTMPILPLRGRPLRDRFVLRLIAVDRVFHFLVIGALGVATFLVAGYEVRLRDDFAKVVDRLQGVFGGSLADLTRVGLVQDLDRLFAQPGSRLYLYGSAIALYAVVNLVEAVGLWRAKRWAEYLTLVEVAVFLPFEIRELLNGVSVLKVITLVLNLLVISYLLYAHRLFGVRGGGRADQAEKDRDTGWAAIQRATPATVSA